MKQISLDYVFIQHFSKDMEQQKQQQQEQYKILLALIVMVLECH